MKKVFIKGLGAIFLIAAIIVTQIPVSEAFASSSVASEFEMNNDTLVKYTGTAEAVSVPATVKEIAPEAFAGNTAIETVTIPEGVESIGYNAFSGCLSLEKVTIPNSVTELGTGVFGNCSSLKTLSIGNNLRNIGYGSFAGCSSLKTISVAKDNSHFTIKNGVLYNHDFTEIVVALMGAQLTEFAMPNTVIKVAPYAFYGCDTLTKVTLSNTMPRVDEYAFYNASALSEIVIPYSVSEIGLKAFADCANLKDVTIYPSVSTIHDTAFDGCVKLNVIADEGTRGYQFFENFKENTIGEEEYEDTNEDIYSIYEGSDTASDVVLQSDSGNSAAIEQVEAESGQTMLGKTVVSSGQAVVFIDNSAQKVNSGAQYEAESTASANSADGQGAEESTVISSVTALFSTTDVKGNMIPKYTVSDGKIAARAFYNSQDMTEYSIPENVSGIGEFSFARSNIGSISIPDGVTDIEYGAFYHCDNLTEVSIPASVTNIEPYAFENTRWLENWYAGNEMFLVVGDGILLAYNGNGSTVEIPDGIKQIGPYAFADHQGLVSVTIPDSVTVVGEGAFSGCNNLSTVNGGTGIQKISDRAFYGCPIGTIRIAEDVKEIGLLAFDESTSQKENITKTAIFYGSTIPSVSYEESALRLSNAEYRDSSLKGIYYAVINTNVQDFNGTVLQDGLAGFHGIIVRITSEATGSAEIVACYLTSEEITNLGLTDKCMVFQKTYTITNWNEYMETLDVRQVAEGTVNIEDTEDAENAGNVSVRNEAASLGAFDYRASLSLTGGSYELVITEDNADADRFEDDYRKLYGSSLPQNTVFLDLSMMESDSQVPITKLGKQRVSLTVPVPETLQNGTLHVVCLDEDGQLEEVPYILAESDVPAITMEISHFSPYAIYSYTGNAFLGEGVVSDGQTFISSLSSDIDDSPNTGDTIHPKWFFAAGLTCAGVVLLLLKKKK